MGLFDWSGSGNNAGLNAGDKESPSGDGGGTWWSRDDGTSGQSQSSKDAETGNVTYWQHDRSASGSDHVTEVKYDAATGGTQITRK